MRFGTWNVRSLYMAGSIIAAARELARYKLDLAGVQEVKSDKRGKITVEITIFFMEKETKVIN
jgi:exonuclease III